MRIIQFITLLALVLTFASNSFGSHIVGGVISYEHDPLPGQPNRYVFTMKIYRDCYNGIPPFDGVLPGDFALIGIFDDSGDVYVDTVQAVNPVIDTVQPLIDNECLVTPPNICVEEGVYTFEYNFPDASKTYYLSYLRCCRNSTISNIVNPSGTGATYLVDVPPTIPYQNSSPIFNSFPPIFICVNSPLVYDHSATDLDGDSLVYSLCTPYDGGSSGAPAPGATPGPYTQINWQAPYDSADPLGGIPLAIDSATGVLTGTPATTGQFVVGICVKEYRNGVLINTLFRDFQFNVALCNFPVANIPSYNIDPTTQIGTYTEECSDSNTNVSFVNASSGATKYSWDFGVTGLTDDTSDMVTPAFVYPDTGAYFVRLIARNDSGCSDTTFAWVYIRPTVYPDFDFGNVCADSLVQFFDSTEVNVGAINSWSWNFDDPGSGSNTSNSQNPVHVYADSGIYNVSLTVTTTDGCSRTIRKDIEVFPLPIPDFIWTTPCVAEEIQFTDTTLGNIQSYSWDFGDASGTSNLQSPTYTYNTAGLYTVRLAVETNFGCKDTIEYPIMVNDTPVATISNDTSVCINQPVQVFAGGGVSYQWSPSSNVDDSTSATPLATPTADMSFIVTVTDINGCTNVDSMRINIFPTLQPDFSTKGLCEDSIVFFEDQTPTTNGTVIQWHWDFGDPGATNDTANTATTSYDYPGPGTYMVQLTVLTNAGCTEFVTLPVTVFPLPVADFTVATACVNANVLFTDNSTGNIQSHYWDFGNNQTSTLAQPTTTYDTAGTYDIMLIVTTVEGCVDTIIRPVQILPIPIVTVTEDTFVCINGSIQVEAGGGVSYQWSPQGSFNNPFTASPVATPQQPGWFSVTVTDANFCENIDSMYIDWYPATPADAGQDTFICGLAGGGGTGVMLNASGGVSYSWTPAVWLNNSNSATPIANPPVTTEFIVTVTDANGCTGQDTMEVLVDINSVSIGGDTLVCSSEFIDLQATMQFPDTFTTYQWMPDSFIVSGQGSSTAQAQAPSSLDIIVGATSSYGCVYYDTFYVEVQSPTFLIDAIAVPDTMELGQIVQLSVLGTQTLPTILWTPSDSVSIPNIFNPTTQPSVSTTFTVTVTDSLGCSLVDTVRVIVIPARCNEPYIYVPNAFSPNNDGKNDTLFVRGNNIESMYFAVYDRWGEMVFETSDQNLGWDGKFKGKDLESSEFAYYLDAVCPGGTTFFKSGSLIIIK